MSTPIAKLILLDPGLEPDHTPTEINIPEDGLTLGSDPQHLLCLNGQDILPFHAEILWNQSDLVIQTLDDQASLFVGNVSIDADHSYPLADGDIIRIGSVNLKFEQNLTQNLAQNLATEPELPTDRATTSLTQALTSSSSSDFLSHFSSPVASSPSSIPSSIPSSSPSSKSQELPGTLMAPQYNPKILQITTPNWTQDFPLTGEKLFLGSAPQSDVLVDSPHVFPLHLMLTLAGGSYRVQPLGPAKLLDTNQAPIRNLVLTEGDCFTIPPDITLTYQILPAEETIEQVETLRLRNRSSLTLGRDPRNDTVIDHPIVSRFHAKILLKGSHWVIQDLHSSNGTFVNNQTIHQPRELIPGDSIRIGPYQFIFSVDETLIQQDETGNLRLDAIRLEKYINPQLKILDNISLSILPKEFVAIVGVSGAGKSTLLNALNGFQPATQGKVCVNGKNLYKNFNAYRMALGYVPQDDIIHQDLAVVQALDFAARLRLPADVTDQERSRQVQAVLRDLELQHRQHVPVKQLSGGQRKRVSIGVELLTKPSLFFLDEATSGLDPGTESQMMRLLRRLADQGRTVMLVTHATKNVMLCDMVVFLAKGGAMAFYGPPSEALAYFGVEDFDEIYLKIEGESTPKQWQQKYLQSEFYQRYIRDRQQDLQASSPDQTPPKKRFGGAKTSSRSSFRQWWILSQRNLALLFQDKASLALTLSVAPFLGLLDFVLWRNDIFDPLTGDHAQVLTLLFVSVLVAVIVGSLATMREIVKEAEIYRRERMIGLQIFPYIFSKLWLCVVLSLYDAAIFFGTKALAVDFPISASGSLGIYVTLFLATLGGMVMGLLVSALSPNQSVAPLLTILFLVPQITFAGSILPLRVLGPVGQGISQITISRWAYSSMISLSEIGKSVAEDPCWAQSEAVREKWGDAEKQKCTCFGPNLFKTCRFPGLWDFRDPAVDEPEPQKPKALGDPPTIPNSPRAILSGNFQDELTDYNQRAERYSKDLDQWQEKYRQWKENRGKAIATGETLLQRTYDNNGHSYKVNVLGQWLRLIGLMFAMIGLLAWIQKRKDAL